MVLAAALLMLYVDKSEREGTVKKTILAIKRGPYRFEEVKESNPMEFSKNESEAVQQPTNGIHITPSGELAMMPEILMGILKGAVKEAVFGVVEELKAQQQELRPVPTTVQPDIPKPVEVPHGEHSKPGNWDRIRELWKSHDLKTSDAAFLCGMSMTEFFQYVNGELKFADEP